MLAVSLAVATQYSFIMVEQTFTRPYMYNSQSEYIHSLSQILKHYRFLLYLTLIYFKLLFRKHIFMFSEVFLQVVDNQYFFK